LKIVLVTGGARAGKSRWAEEEALRAAGQSVTYVATAEPRDEEMTRRIAAHRAERPDGWTTVEAPIDVPGATFSAATPAVLLDCVTVWVSNLMLLEGEQETTDSAGSADGVEARVREAVDGLLDAARNRDGLLLIVTNEVGLGLVPDNPLGRLYRDLLGWVNARIAREAREVMLMVAGIPLRVR